jgi:hypothetical protein
VVAQFSNRHISHDIIVSPVRHCEPHRPLGDVARDEAGTCGGNLRDPNGHIVARRDYFDMGLVGKLMAGEDTATLLPHSGISAVALLGQSVNRW